MSQKQIKFKIDGLRVSLSGLGAVGSRLAARLAEAGAHLQVADIVPERVRRAVDRWGATGIDSERAHAVPSDVFVPCAAGPVIDASTLAELGARAVAGSANNVLDNAECGAELHRRGILYAPDFVINSGALVHGALFHLQGVAPPRERIERIGSILSELFEESAAVDLPPEVVAEREARKGIEAATGDIHLPVRP